MNHSDTALPDVFALEKDYTHHLWIFSFGLSLFAIASYFKPYGNSKVSAPKIGLKLPYVHRLQFLLNAWKPVQEGYEKHYGGMYKLLGDEILVLPNKYVDELRNIPEERLSSMIANIDNFQGCYSTCDVLLHGNMHTRVIQTRLTPKLGTFVPDICAEIKRSLPLELPPCRDDWATAPAFKLIVKLIARNFARTALGPEMSDDKRWLSIAVDYPENVFKTVIIMRMIPKWLKPIVAWFVPPVWIVSMKLRQAQNLIVPIIEERRRAEREDEGYEKPHDFLQWMMDGAQDEYDAKPKNLVHRLLVLALASVHTTSMAACQAFFDIVERPEYVEPLREEILSSLRAENGWKKTTLTKLKMMDSFMRESQRLNPPSLLGFKRSVEVPLTLSDGTHLPRGVHMVMPVVPVAQDERLTSYPLEFDGFRHFRERQKEGQSTKHQFASTDRNNMHFGHGKYSCPGRFYASNTIKIILSHLLMGYDFKFPEGKGRPRNLCLHEYVFPDPDSPVLFKMKRDDLVIDGKY